MSRLPRLLASAVLVGAALLAATGATAQQLSPSGALLTVAGKQVPLPGGGWRIAARGEPGQGGVPLPTIVLVRGDGARVGALALVRFNPRPRTAIFASTRECSREDSYFAAVRYDTPSDGYCHFGNLVLPDWTAATAPLADAVASLRRGGFLLPSALMQVGIRARTREHVIDVRYYFVPPDVAAPRSAARATPAAADRGTMEATGLDWSTHVLSPTRLDASPQLRIRAAQLAAWADLLQGELERGVRGRLDATAAALPLPWDSAAVAERRIAQARGTLDALLAASEIDRPTYEAALAAIEEAMREPETQGMTLWVRSLWKLGTYRVASIVDAVIVSLFFMDATQTAILMAVNQVVRPASLYLHEIAWASSGVGRPAASLRPVDFDEIGANRAR